MLTRVVNLVGSLTLLLGLLVVWTSTALADVGQNPIQGPTEPKQNNRCYGAQNSCSTAYDNCYNEDWPCGDKHYLYAWKIADMSYGWCRDYTDDRCSWSLSMPCMRICVYKNVFGTSCADLMCESILYVYNAC